MCHYYSSKLFGQIKAYARPIILNEKNTEKVYFQSSYTVCEVMENLSSFAKLPMVVKHIVNFNEN